MGEAAADPDQLARYSDELTIHALTLNRLLGGTTKGLVDQYMFCHPEMRTANATGVDEAISAIGHAHYIDQQVGVVGQAFRAAGGSGTLTDAALETAISLNPTGHDAAYWKTLQKLGTTGTDATLRDEANRELLGHQLSDLQTQQAIAQQDLTRAEREGDEAATAKAKAELKEIARKEGILTNINTALTDPKSKLPHYLLQFDTKGATGHSVVATGDPFTAKNVSTIVPGTMSGGTRTTTYVKDADLLYNKMGTTSGTRAVVAWDGYEAPQNAFTQAWSPAYAYNGAAALSNFEKQLRSANPSARLTVIGHSYGSVEVAYAGLRGLPVDNVVFTASPAVPPEALAKLEGQGVHLYAARLPFDVISLADHISESIDGVAPVSTPLVGTDPLNFPGVQHFHTGFARDDDGKINGGWTDISGSPGHILSRASKIHGEYFSTPGSLDNLAAISNGLPVTKPTENEQAPGVLGNGLQHLFPTFPGLTEPLPPVPGVDWGKVHLPNMHLPDVPLPNVHIPTPTELPNPLAPLSELGHLPDPL